MACRRRRATVISCPSRRETKTSGSASPIEYREMKSGGPLHGPPLQAERQPSQFSARVPGWHLDLLASNGRMGDGLRVLELVNPTTSPVANRSPDFPLSLYGYRIKRGEHMSDVTRRQLVRGALIGTALMGTRRWLAGAQSVSPVTPAGAPGSAIIPPTGIAEDKPRLQGIRRVIVDTDPGNDDALALLMAMQHPQIT